MKDFRLYLYPAAIGSIIGTGLGIAINGFVSKNSGLLLPLVIVLLLTINEIAIRRLKK